MTRVEWLMGRGGRWPGGREWGGVGREWAGVGWSSAIEIVR